MRDCLREEEGRVGQAIIPGLVSVLIFVWILGTCGYGVAEAQQSSQAPSKGHIDSHQIETANRGIERGITGEVDQNRHASDVAQMKQYRDEFLSRTKKGKFRTLLAYKISEKALEVLDENPELLPQARELAGANIDGALQALNEEADFSSQNSEEIISFLDSYAEKAPLLLKIGTLMLKRKVIKRQKRAQRAATMGSKEAEPRHDAGQ
jgi:hypothetical protein